LTRRGQQISRSREPFLRAVRLRPGAQIDPSLFPFSIPAFSAGLNLELEKKVTFLVGENGTGKSTLLEAIASACGFPLQGGARDHAGSGSEEAPPLAAALQLAWMPKVSEGFFFRAESFYNFAEYIDAVGNQGRYGGEARLHAQSHGESFLALFQNRFREGLFILDEPEAALSPQRQLAFLRVLHELEHEQRSQFLIATHAPILLHYPGAAVLSMDGDSIEPIKPEETEHVRLTRDFLAHPEVYLRSLFAKE